MIKHNIFENSMFFVVCTSAGKNIVIGIRRILGKVLSLIEIERLINVIFDIKCCFLFIINKCELTKAARGQGPPKRNAHARFIAEIDRIKS